MISYEQLVKELALTPDDMQILTKAIERLTPLEKFAPVLTRLRQQRRLTKNRLARAAGLTPGAITRLEKGERHPTRTTIAKLVTALKLPPDQEYELYAAAGYLPPPSSPRTTQPKPATQREKRTTSERHIPSSPARARTSQSDT